MSDDLTGTGRQPSLGCSAGQEMDGVPISADLRPGGNITVGEPAGPGAGGRINSGPAVRDFPPPGCPRTGLGATLLLALVFDLIIVLAGRLLTPWLRRRKETKA